MLAVLALFGCESKKREGAEAPPAATAPAVIPDAMPDPIAPRKAKFPPEARRDSIPVGVPDNALAVGKPTPALEQMPSTTGAWSRGENVTALVFYRGHW